MADDFRVDTAEDERDCTEHSDKELMQVQDAAQRYAEEGAEDCQEMVLRGVN
jgi:hypothetical protein